MKLTKEQKEFIENYGRDYLFGGNTKIGEIYGTMQKEIERLNSIIKEVREYIEENMSYIEKGKLEYIPSGEELLEILKGSDKE